MAGKGRIRAADIALVRERSRIDEVVGDHLQLRRAGGGSLKGLCPFHDEKSPSFHVTPARGLYHCLAGETGKREVGGVPYLDFLGLMAGTVAIPDFFAPAHLARITGEPLAA